MNEIVKKNLLAGDRFMPEMHLRQLAYGDFIHDKAFNVAKNPNCDSYQRGLTVNKCFNKKISDDSVTYAQSDNLATQNKSAIKNEFMSNQCPLDLACVAKVSDGKWQLAEELHKPIIWKIEKHKTYLSFKGNIWGADLADMQLKNKCNEGFQFLWCVIDTFCKYTLVVPLKDTKIALQLLMLFKTF